MCPNAKLPQLRGRNSRVVQGCLGCRGFHQQKKTSYDSTLPLSCAAPRVSLSTDVHYRDILSLNVCPSYDAQSLNAGNKEDLSFDSTSADAGRQTRGKTSVFCLRAGVSRGGGGGSFSKGLFVICTTATFCAHTSPCLRREDPPSAGFVLLCAFIIFFHLRLSRDSLAHFSISRSYYRE